MKPLKPADFREIAERAFDAHTRCKSHTPHTSQMALLIAGDAAIVAFGHADADIAVMAIGRLIARVCLNWKMVQSSAPNCTYNGVHVALHDALFPKHACGLMSSAKNPAMLCRRLNRIALAAEVEHPKEEAMKVIEWSEKQTRELLDKCAK